MTTSELEMEVAEIKTRLRRVENALLAQLGEQRDKPQTPDLPLSNEELLAWMRAQGLVRDPTPEELRLAAEWDNLPEEEKQAVLWELDHLPPGPMASDIIIENRR